MSAAEDFREKMHKANIQVHQVEAKYYELIHNEIYGKAEQKRISSTLKKINKLILDNQRKALDFGAGTGNITGKLLRMGYTVTAVDISPEMCNILKIKFKNYLENKKLKVISSPIEDVCCGEGEFDLITSYSVLHHLPNYLNVIHKLSTFLRRGGVMYLDHEDAYYLEGSNIVELLVKFIHFQFNRLFNKLFFRIKGVAIPSLGLSPRDYSLSDYWDSDRHHLDYERIELIFEKENFNFFTRIYYHLNSSRIFNPTFYIFKYLCRPNIILWVAKK